VTTAPKSTRSCSGAAWVLRLGTALGLVGATVVVALSGSGAGAFPSSARWTPAEVSLPSNAATGTGGILNGVSCPSAGDCTAVGSYTDNSSNGQGMAAVESGGIWAQASEIPAPSDADTPGETLPRGISCTSVGNCTAVGAYKDNGANFQALVADESAGTWSQAAKITAPSGAATNPEGVLWSITCSSSGNCSAGGDYHDGSGHVQAMAATETSGTWAQAVEVTAPTGAAANPVALLHGVSCTSAGNCTGTGQYTDGSGNVQAMAATETSGTWAQAVEVTAPTGAAANPEAYLASVSCSSAGNCTGTGRYTDGSGNVQAMAATETSGTWAQAVEVTAPTGAAANPVAFLSGVSCTSVGNCTAAGYYTDSSSNDVIMNAVESGGTWAQATEFAAPANAAGNPGAELEGISCASEASCTAVGDYVDNNSVLQPMATTLSTSGPIEVFARGTNGDLYEYTDSSAGGRLWNAVDLTSVAAGGVGIMGRPSAFIDTFDQLTHVYVRTAANHMVEYVDDNVGGHLWNAYDLTFGGGGATAVGGDPSAFFDVFDLRIHVYVQALNGDMVEYVDDNVGGHLWNQYDLSVGASGGTPVIGAPSALVGANDHLIHVYTQAAGGHLVEYVDGDVGGHLWNAWDLSAGASGGGPVAGSPGAFYDFADHLIHVYVSAGGGHLTEYVDGDVGGHPWNAWDLSAGASGGSSITGTPSPFFGSDDLIHVYVSAGGGHLTEYVDGDVGGHLWNAWDLSAGASGGGPVAGSPSAFFDFPDGLVHVFVPGPGGDLVEYDNGDVGGTLWNAWDITFGSGGPATWGDPSALLAVLVV